MKHTPSRWLRIRMHVVTGLIGILFACLCTRAYVLQVRNAGKMKNLAEDQYRNEVELPPKRGRILDRQGVALAASAEVDSISANPRLVGAQATQVAKTLAEPLHLDVRELEKRLKVNRYFSWVKRRAEPEEARSVRELAVPGIFLAKEPRRYYPHRGLAGPLLGWAGLDGVGQEGIELQYDRYLRGQKGAVSGLRDALGRMVLTGGAGDSSQQLGRDVVTTIDRYIQYRLEQHLMKAVEDHHAKAGVAGALDPSNGEIMAMASVPTVNPNDPDGAHDRGVRNRSVTDPFEPGSTMKTFTLAGALESGVIHVEDNWYCENGSYKVGPATIHDAERIGDATTTEVLAKSSNICTAKIAARQGKERLREFMIRFGFGKPTEVDLPGERAGQVRPVAKMGSVETATMSFGQGVTATPLQMANAYATIAAGGVWHRPHVVRKVVSVRGEVLFTPAESSRKVISPELTKTMQTMLFAVSQKGGTGQRLKIPGYSFAGKTGTAQKVDPATRRYSAEKWASSFVGYAPSNNPRLVLFVMIDEPRGEHHGSTVAGPVFQNTMIDALRWLGVPPDQEIAAPIEVAQKPRKKAAPVAVKEAADEESDDESNPADKLPDFTGMSVAEALEAAKRVGIRLEVSGSGFATAQAPGPGRKNVKECKVAFLPPG